MKAEALQNLDFEDVRGKHVLLALSGGADSVALLHLLHQRHTAGELTLAAAHYHHGIRASHADGDAAFCRELCRRLNIEYREGRGDVPALAREMHCGLETAARHARYAYLRNVQRDWQADVIALAHHLNDQVETILMHLFRGAGPEGICGMARMQDGLYRPLLGVSKAELIAYLQEHRLEWREDASNAVNDNPRNELRLNVLPGIEKHYPVAMEAIARYGQLARMESDYIARMTEDFLSERLERGPYGMRLILRGSEEPVILRRAVRKLAGDFVSMDKMEEIMQLLQKKRGRTEISGNLAVEKTPAALYFLPNRGRITAEVPLRIPGETLLPGVCRIVAELGNFDMEPGCDAELFDADLLQGALVRTRRDGDRIRPLGFDGDRLLSDYLTDKKIDRPLRNCMALVARGERILWACGVGMAHDARITEQTRRKVRLSIHSITHDEPEERI